MDKDRVFEIFKFVEEFKRNETDNASTVISNIWRILDKVRELKERHRNKKREIPFSVLSFARIDEEANSRILKEILSIRRNNRYEFFEMFVRSFLGDSFDHSIKNPKFSNEEHRIDILVKDSDYAIIFENKIRGAVDQKNQLARYIESMQKEGYTNEKIFVVYLPLDDHEPSDCSWKKPQECCRNCRQENTDKCRDFYSYREEFEPRYLRLSFSDDILPWIKEEVIPECKVMDQQLYTALIQYKVYLETLSRYDELNDTEKMEIKDQLRGMLKFTDNDFENHSLVVKQLRDLRTVADQLESLEFEARENCVKDISGRLQSEYPDCKVQLRPDKHWYFFGLHFQFRGKMYRIGLEENVSQKRVYYGFLPPSGMKVADVKEEISDIVNHYMSLSGFHSSAVWPCYKYISYAEALDAIKEMLTYCKEHE